MPNEQAHTPDILSCIAHLSSDEVFTPPKIANQVLDLLPAEIWTDETTTFLDPCTKSGVFLREIARRLIAGLETKIPDLNMRLDHIFKNQVFGIAITELTALLSRRSLYCSKYANSRYSVVKGFSGPDGNIRFVPTKHEWKHGRCVFCGASASAYDRDIGLESHAYEFIHKTNPEEIFNMKFDVIVGNPPYHLKTGGSGKQATPIYDKFVLQAKKMNPRYLTMIIPSRWFAGGMGLNKFRQDMLKDKRMKRIVDFNDSRECFPGVDIAGGVCYFLWDKNHSGKTEIISRVSAQQCAAERDLSQFNVLIRSNEAVPILEKVSAKTDKNLTEWISSTIPFGLATKERPDGHGHLTLLSSAGTGKIQSERVTSGLEMIDKWKVITSKTSHDHGGKPDSSGKRRVLSRLEVCPPKTVCTGSYIVLGCFPDKQQAENLRFYASTKFFRFLLSLLIFSHDITREKFRFVPLLNIDTKWSDQMLNEYFNLSESEVNFINNSIKEF